MVCLPSEDSDQPGHPPSLIRVFAVRMKKAWVLSNSKNSDQTGCMPRLIGWVDAQAGLSLRWAHMPLCCFCHEAACILNVVYLWHKIELLKIQKNLFVFLFFFVKHFLPRKFFFQVKIFSFPYQVC